MTTETRVTRDWFFTDDREDPCGLCVGWEEAEDPMDGGRPIWPDGSTVTRVYRFTHGDCQAAAIRYSMETVS